MTNGWDHERIDDTPHADRARAIDPAQNARRPTRLSAARAWDHERNDDTPHADRARATDPAQNASRSTRLPAARE